MRHINLDGEHETVKQFVLSLEVDADGSVLELDGAAVVRILPVADEPVDRAKLEAAILARRDASRTLNKDWEDVDHELWSRIPDAND